MNKLFCLLSLCLTSASLPDNQHYVATERSVCAFLSRWTWEGCPLRVFLNIFCKPWGSYDYPILIIILFIFTSWVYYYDVQTFYSMETGYRLFFRIWNVLNSGWLVCFLFLKCWTDWSLGSWSWKLSWWITCYKRKKNSFKIWKADIK